MEKEKKKKIIYISGIAAITLLVLSYLAVSLFFLNRYNPGTRIGDFQCGGKRPTEVEAMISDRAGNYRLTIQGREEMEASLDASEIQLQFVLDDTLKEIVNRQSGFAWLPSVWKGAQYDLPVSVSYDSALLDEKLSDMLFFQNENMRKPVNAYIGEYDEESGLYPIVEEEKGTVVDRQKTKAAVIHAIENMEEILVLEEADCYMEPDISQDDEDLVRFCSRLNRFVSSRIVYDWHGMEEVVDGSQIHEWLDIDRENQFVTINAEAVREYINLLSKKHDTFGAERQFRTSEGKTVTLKPGSYGWRVDRATETEKLIKLIRSGSQTEREPEYLYMAAAKGENDIGDSYVEINLTAQHLYLYVEGELITESDFVSGNVSRGFTTPDGVYGLTYKTLNATLRGQGYASPVDFWMPFNGNIGMHDASWRRQFGGNIYLRNGSHGCINLPRDAAEKIYEQVYKGFPVVCYSEGTSSSGINKNNNGNTSEQTNQAPPGDATDPGGEAEGGGLPVDPGAVVIPDIGTVVDPNTGIDVIPGDGTGIDPGTGIVPGTGTEVDPNVVIPGTDVAPGTVVIPDTGAPAVPGVDPAVIP